jgi:hypothetical protein
MTTIQIALPDELAQEAREAGLLTPEAIEQMLREQLRKHASEELRAMCGRMPAEELTPEESPATKSA